MRRLMPFRPNKSKKDQSFLKKRLYECEKYGIIEYVYIQTDGGRTAVRLIFRVQHKEDSNHEQCISEKSHDGR